ncbi:Probable protein arginine N-methyltransferase 6 [Linum grandiflorum]
MYSNNSDYTNGYHDQLQQQQQQRLVTAHRPRVRRGSRSAGVGGGVRSRDYGDGFRGFGEDHNSHQHQQPLPPSTQSQGEQNAAPCTDFDMAYFNSYAHVGIHEEMIKDRVRTDTYRSAILQHQSHIEGKVVLDVGCGTGILAIFCAQAGAKRVYAVDASDIAVQAREVVKANNLSDRIIVLHGRVEDVEIDEEVDVIVSEWMGYMLLYESMLGSVITARDKWLKRGGLILPSNATLYMAPITHPDRYTESIDFWRNVYGIDMSAMLPLAKQCAFEEPSVETISGENVLTWPHVVKHVDCYTLQIHELESVTTRFKFESMMRAPFHGFAFWFDVEFNGPANSAGNSNAQQLLPPESPNSPSLDGIVKKKKRSNPNNMLMLSTAPEDPPTHWQQTLIYFYEPIEVEQDQVIEGSLTLSQSKENRRFMNIHLEYSSGGRSFVKESVMR